MHTLYLTDIQNQNRVRTTRLIRQAMADLGTPGQSSDVPTHADADMLIAAFARDGYALLARSEGMGDLAEVKNELAKHGLVAVIDYDPEAARRVTELPRNVRRQQTREDAEAGLSPEEVFAKRAPGRAQAPAEPQRFTFSTEAYETAMVLIVMADGNPANAAANCHALKRTTEDDRLYTEVQAAIIQAFPHLDEPMRANGFRLEP